MTAALLLVALCAASAVLAGPAPTAWTLATDDTRVRLAVREDRLFVESLEAVRAPASFVGPGAEIPLPGPVEVGGRSLRPGWRFAGADRDARAGTLSLRFVSEQPALEARSVWRARRGRGPIEHWWLLANRTASPVVVGQQESLLLPEVRAASGAQAWWIQRGASNASTQGGVHTEALGPDLDLTLVSNCEDGASPVPWLAVQVGEERGLYVGWEFSGMGRVRARGLGEGRAQVRVGLLEDFRTEVAAGATFVVPAAFVGCYAGDLDEGSYSLHRFIVEKLRPPVPAGYPDPSLNYAIYLDAGGPTACREEDLLRVARFAHSLGFEAFMPDAMWFPACGDWRWDPARFPNGIGPVERFVHEHGMKQALWCAWTNGGVSEHEGALSIRGRQAHPDWFRSDVAPDWQPGPFYGAQLCLASEEARAWAVAKTQWLVKEHRLDYLKHDCGPIVTTCQRTDHRHRFGVDASYWATMGYYQVQEALRRACPGLVLENCSGGGHIKDFGVVQRTHYTVTTDTLSNLPDRQSIYDSTLAFPPILLQAYTYDTIYHARGDEPGPYFWRSAMMSAWQFAPANSASWTEEEAESARSAVRIYKQWVRPMLRDARVHHVLPRPDGLHWDGLFYYSPRLRRGTLYVFRPDSPEERRSVPLRGLAPERRYWVWSEDGSVAAGVRTGSELMGAGVDLSLPARYSSDLVYVREEGLGRPAGLAEPGPFRLGLARTESDVFGVAARLDWRRSPGARSYRLVVSRHPDLSDPLVARAVYGTSARLSALPQREGLYWRVEALSLGGRRWSEGEAGRMTTPARKELAGVTFVSDLPWTRATIGVDDRVRRDANLYGRPISIGGRTFARGVWTHAFNDATPADVVIAAGGRGWGLFAAEVGLDDASGGGSVQFVVLGDGSVLAQSPVLRPGQVYSFRVPIEGAKEVVLRVLNGGDGYSCDHAAWGMARFIAAGSADPLADGDLRVSPPPPAPAASHAPPAAAAGSRSPRRPQPPGRG